MTSPDLKRKRDEEPIKILCYIEGLTQFCPLRFEPSDFVASWREQVVLLFPELPSYTFHKLDAPMDATQITALPQSTLATLPVLTGGEQQSKVISGIAAGTCQIVIKYAASLPSPPSNPRQRFIGTLRTKAISPSQFALPSNYKAATDSTEKLRTHPATDRPLTAQPDVPNTLLCGIFRRFLDNVQSSCPLPEDYDLAIAMRACMSEIYAHESMLRDAMNKIFMARFQESMAPHAILGRYEVDGLQWLSKIMVALAEYKKDASGGSEPQFQSVHYYSTATINEAEKDLQRRLPLLLMTCVGSVLTFSGGVWNSEKPVVQKLFEATASFDWDMSNDEAMEKAARLMRAYSIAITEISVYKDPAHSADFPDVTSWDDPQHGGQHQFRYVERVPGHLLFRATDESNQRLLVKFTKRYSPELHHFCAQKGFAPELKAVVDIGGRWRMVVMADVSEAYHSVGESQEFSSIVTHPCLEQFKRAVQGMHNAGFVHGDIRLPNILVHKTDVNKPLLLVDFDWGGLANEVRYPGALNPVIQRHSGARSGLCITTDHDTFMLEQL